MLLLLMDSLEWLVLLFFPGGRTYSAGWSDNNDVIWIFGGIGFDSAMNYGVLNDLWSFTAGNWTWVTGSDTFGAPTSATGPGARQGMVYWKDTTGNLYIYGGQDVSGQSLNELWMWDVNNFTWCLNPNTQGPAVAWASAVIGTNNYVWLFGGYQNSLDLGDLWMWDGTNWNDITGNHLADQPSVVNGTNPANLSPGSRINPIFWISENILWLYGGNGFGASGVGDLSDLWRVNSTMIVTTLYPIPTTGIILVVCILLSVFIVVLSIAIVLDCTWSKIRFEDTMHAL